MKRLLSFFLILLLILGGCAVTDSPATEQKSYAFPTEYTQIPYQSRFNTETHITLSDSGITVNGGNETDTVYTSRDIVYYEEKTAYESGNPYGAGESSDMHSAEEADSHTVVNITAPGAYRISGKLSAGQIRIDLGKKADEDPEAVVELILDNADITCTVAPAILFQNVYECDGGWDVATATADVDTSAAGAVLVLENSNRVDGSYVAKIYKDKEGEKKLWKQDGAIYSYMSMNVFGPGSLELTAANEGLDSELHLTVNGGKILIRSANDGINTNEDGVSVTTINGGFLHITASLGAEGDGIDSNGYLVIRDGIVISSAHPASDAGLDSDLGSFIHGGTVIALGSTMDWAESDSQQVTMNLQFAQYQSGDSAISIRSEDGTTVFAYDPSDDPLLQDNLRRYQGAVISCPDLTLGEGYHVYIGTQQMMFTGTDVQMHPGGIGGFPGNMGGQRPEGNRGEMPEGFDPGQLPEGFTPPESNPGQGNMPPELPEGGQMPPDFGSGQMGRPGSSGQWEIPSEGNVLFYMHDKVNAFSGVAPATE